MTLNANFGAKRVEPGSRGLAIGIEFFAIGHQLSPVCLAIPGSCSNRAGLLYLWRARTGNREAK